MQNFSEFVIKPCQARKHHKTETKQKPAEMYIMKHTTQTKNKTATQNVKSIGLKKQTLVNVGLGFSSEFFCDSAEAVSQQVLVRRKI